METELERCLSGEWYDCRAPVLMGFKRETYKLLLKYNLLPCDYKEEKYTLLKEALESVGKKVSVGRSFICDYGCSISIGNNVNINTGYTFVDCNKIITDSNVLIAPNVQICTATHPVELSERLIPTETEGGIAYIRHTYVLSVTTEDGYWIGGGVTILPGVTTDQGSVIGAGSAVIKSIPANSFAVENPCKVVRGINTSI